MAAFDLPSKLHGQVKRVVIFADNDELKPVRSGGDRQVLRCAGMHYAEQLAQRIRTHGKRVLIVRAGRKGADMADHLAQKVQSRSPSPDLAVAAAGE
jgi:hypothetical protein